ncbi:MAG: hypothetical protein GX868_00030 [Actinobacteria bacterium]|nr:hypothetical protein [Actinomycetota bacterium]
MSVTAKRLRAVALDKAFGGGLAGFAASAAIGWGVDQLRKANDPISLEVSSLRPGEQYIVSTRPPMARAERTLDAKRRAAQRKLDNATAPSAKVRKTAKKLARQQRLAAKRAAGSAGQLKAEAKAERLGQRFDRLTAPTRRTVRLQRQIAAYDAVLSVERAKALAPTQRKRRRPRTRTYR